MSRTLTFPAALELGHKLATKHVARHDQPNRYAWYGEYEAWCDKMGARYSDEDKALIQAYAEGALRYDYRHTYPAGRPGGLWTQKRFTNAQATEEAR